MQLFVKDRTKEWQKNAETTLAALNESLALNRTHEAELSRLRAENTHLRGTLEGRDHPLIQKLEKEATALREIVREYRRGPNHQGCVNDSRSVGGSDRRCSTCRKADEVLK